MILKNKTVLLGVTGCIAAYKSASLASLLVKAGAEVHVIMTENATNFINPITFETLTSQKCIIDTFDRDFEFDVKHVSLVQKADVIMVAPATANTISKIANGICDNLLCSTLCAFTKPILIAPAMNTGMWNNVFVQENISKLAKNGYHIINPENGYLACGTNGVGRMAEVEDIFEKTSEILAQKQILKGKRILITAGGTKEKIDPVRYISNYSSGKMGIALADIAHQMGAEVTLVSTFNLNKSYKNIVTESAQEMEKTVKYEL